MMVDRMIWLNSAEMLRFDTWGIKGDNIINDDNNNNNNKAEVKCSRYRPGVTQRVVRGIALLFHDSGTRRE